MSKKIRKKSSQSTKSTRESKPSRTTNKTTNKTTSKSQDSGMWKLATFVLGFLVVVSILTNGFRFGVSVDSVVTDLNTLNTKDLPSNVKSAVTSALTGLEKVQESMKVDKTDDLVNSDAIVIEEFSDFECPFCARAYPTVNQVLAEYGDKVVLDYKHFPLSFHANAKKAAEASECARDQEQFKEYHDVLFETQELDVTSLKKHAADLGLDTSKFNSCLDNGDKTSIVDADFNEGRTKGVGGTPTFFINGQKIVGAQPFANFKTAIDAALNGEAPVVDAQQPETPPPAPDVPKADKPEVELFVMSHCPYGTQMEKGILPVLKVLGDSVEFDLNFVYYAMHGEVEVVEQAKQYCIQRDQKDKLQDYLVCFLEDGETERCLDAVGIDVTKMDACVAEIDEEFKITENLEDTASWLSGRFPLFNTDKADNDEYGVRGSPTLVINGQSVSSARDSKSLLSTICESFNEKPDACNTEFESTAPGPGFGFDTTGGNAAAAGCGY